MMNPTRYIKYWLWAGIVLIAMMVIIGGVTRLTGSGLSIVEWNLISGILPPLSAEQWQVTFEQYKQFPEYKMLNAGMTLSSFKQIFFWEYLHRLLGRLTGIVFLLPFLFFVSKGWLTKSLTLKLFLIFLLGALQGAMGWYMVKSGLADVPHVSHFRLAAHQSLALLLMGAIYWTILSLESNKKEFGGGTYASTFVPGVVLVLLFTQIVLGAFVAGLKSGFSFNNFPFMGDSFFPSPQVINSKQWLYNGAVLQFIHRWLAFGVVLGFAALFYLGKSRAAIQHYVKGLFIIGLVQIGLGIATLLFQVPVVLGVAHQFVALLLVMMLIKIVYVLRYEIG
jgi:heme a synthase